MRTLIKLIFRVILFGLILWCALLSYYSPLFGAPANQIIAALLAFGALLALFYPGRLGVPIGMIAGAVLGFWFQLPPSSDRDWRPELSKVPYAEIKGDEITIFNVRDARYRTEDDFDLKFSDKKLRISDLSALDIFVSYWAGKDIAHVFVTFGFTDPKTQNTDYIAVSIEARKTTTQAYSSIAGFFRNYELIYVVAEERDLVGLRTKIRQPNEDVHLLRVAFFKENATKFFLSYIDEINKLHKNPRFYNTLTSNCTTQVLANAHSAGAHSAYNWKVLLSGHTPEYLYEMGNLDSAHTVEELMKLGWVNERSNAFLAKDGERSPAEFSSAIRQGVPKPDKVEAVAW